MKGTFRNINGNWYVQMPQDYKFTTGQHVTVVLRSGKQKSVVLEGSKGNGQNIFYFHEAA